MELDQAVQLINWLDDEHRKDKAQISELAGQISSLYAQISGLNKTVQDLEERIARVQSHALRYSQLEQAISQIKPEVQITLEQYDKRRVQAEEDQFQVRQLERERQEQVSSALQLQIEALQQFQRSILGDHDLIDRINLTLPTFQREIEDTLHRDEEVNHRLQLVEEWVPRFGQLATEQRQLAERLTKERADAVEAARRAEQSRARHMAEWAEQMKASRREVDEWVAQIRAMLEQNKENRKILNEVQEVEERLKQLEPRLLQWQRLVEETRRKEREQIVSELEKRWQTQMGEFQFLRDEWSKRMATVADRIGKLEDWRPEVMSAIHEQVERLEKEQRERMAMVAATLTLWKVMSDINKKSQSDLEKSITEMLATIEGERAGMKPRPRAQTTLGG